MIIKNKNYSNNEIKTILNNCCSVLADKDTVYKASLLLKPQSKQRITLKYSVDGKNLI